jgi:hypothetical protein
MEEELLSLTREMFDEITVACIHGIILVQVDASIVVLVDAVVFCWFCYLAMMDKALDNLGLVAGRKRNVSCVLPSFRSFSSA